MFLGENVNFSMREIVFSSWIWVMMTQITWVVHLDKVFCAH
ncbi:unnamed protein product, partial [Brugia timori]|uniref:Uncharacterized protein n=1 Tax=Brugia timori TaxID=42155 RepID=A0A0R3RB20_9BILA